MRQRLPSITMVFIINGPPSTMSAAAAIADLAEQLRGVLGYAKEIDMLRSRMAALERHVGIAK